MSFGTVMYIGMKVYQIVTYGLKFEVGELGILRAVISPTWNSLKIQFLFHI